MSSWEYKWGLVAFDCEEVANLPTVSFLYGGYWYEVRPIDYAVATSSGQTCVFCIQGASVSKWVLGDAFMRGFYAIHDHTNNRQSLIPMDDGYGLKSDPEEATEFPTLSIYGTDDDEDDNDSTYSAPGKIQGW